MKWLARDALISVATWAMAVIPVWYVMQERVWMMAAAGTCWFIRFIVTAPSARNRDSTDRIAEVVDVLVVTGFGLLTSLLFVAWAIALPPVTKTEVAIIVVGVGLFQAIIAAPARVLLDHIDKNRRR